MAMETKKVLGRGLINFLDIPTLINVHVHQKTGAHLSRFSMNILFNFNGMVFDEDFLLAESDYYSHTYTRTSFLERLSGSTSNREKINTTSACEELSGWLMQKFIQGDISKKDVTEKIEQLFKEFWE
jgi:hypothetical protein